MCNDKFVRDMIDKHKPAPLYCKVNNSCWCAKIQHKFLHENDTCLSPQELLASASALLSDADLIYLRGLSCRTFIPIDN